MTLDFMIPGEARLTMIPYVKAMVNKFLEHDNCSKTVLTPAGVNLFKVDPDCPAISEELATVFHNMTAKALFLTKRARPDLSTAVAFLTTRVKKPDEQDWIKLVRMMRYLRGCPELPLILRADSVPIPKWWIDGAHAVHNDCRGHSGAAMSLGKGAIISGSTKQKINTRSSTETELVATDDYMPPLLWTNHFLRAQQFECSDTVLYQDNMSTILLEKNGKKSISKRTKHLNITYFFITDRIADGDLEVKYCPSSEMIADFFPKPLQGKLFLKFQALIMNHD